MKKALPLIVLMVLALTGMNLTAQNYALHLDGTNDKIGVLDSPELNPATALTLEAWINADEWAGSIWGACIISKQGTDPDKGFGFTVGENGRIEFNHSIDESWKAVQTGQILGPNTWYHIAGVYDGSTMKIYVNGILQAEVNVQGTPTPGNGVVMNFGDNPTWPGRFFAGTLDEIRIWNVARSEEEIRDNMSTELTGSEPGLVGYWNMNEGSGLTIADASGNGNDGTLLNMDETAWVEGFVPPGADAGVLAIAAPSVVGSGFTTEEQVKLDVKNFSTQDINSFDISYQINGGEVVTETINETLPAFSSKVFAFSQMVDLSGLDEVIITGKVHLDGDTSPGNDEVTDTITQSNHLVLFDQEQHNFGSAGQTHFNTVYLPDDLSGYSRINLTIDLNCPVGGCDPWDQPALLNIVKDGAEMEIARYITPFGVACGGWEYDITDFKPLLAGKAVFESIVRVWGASGWLVSMDIDFVPGTPDYPYILVDKLWNENNWVYGDTAISYDLPVVTVPINPNTESAKIRMTVSGHGQGNTMNAAEFAEFTHHIWVDGSQAFDMHLWKDDCNENTCSPQSGTYLYSRAGWCPGQDVQPWEFNLEGLFTPGSDIDLDFVLADYINYLNTGYNGSSHTEPHFRIQAYLVQYASEAFVGIDDDTAGRSNIAGLQVYPNPSAGRYNISATGNDISSISVYRLDGSLVISRHAGMAQNYALDLSQQPAGIYFLRVQTTEGVSVVKIAKQ